MMDADQVKNESVEEVELVEIKKTDCQKTDRLEIVSVSQDEEKVLQGVPKKIITLRFASYFKNQGTDLQTACFC